jgi:lipoate-protein ligase A
LDKATAVSGHWRIVEERGPAEALHADAAGDLNAAPVRRTVRFPVLERPALVLGSHQSEAAFDREAVTAAGLDVARRQSGGSAVLVAPATVLWADFVIPAGDPLWDADVGRAAWWVGQLWAAAIGAGEVWRGPMRTNVWSPVVCFAGLGPGEVTVGGRKVVGVCQRRTRRGALFQTAALLDWRPADYMALLAREVGPPKELEGAATGLGATEEARLKAALRAALLP